MRGRKPVLHPLGEVVDLPISSVRVPEAPDHLSERAKQCWKEVAAILVSKNIYDADCQHLLAAFCVQYGRFLEANEMVKKLGLEGDEACRWRVISNQAHDRMFKLSTELGLTAVSRKRVQRNRGVSGGFLSKKKV
jgi:P27 family predicted phage terminase small subunit